MKRIAALLIMLTVAVQALFAQNDNVKWNISSEKTGDDSYKVLVTGVIADGWHVYDNQEYDGGPNPTVVKFEPSDSYELVGEPVLESEVLLEYSDLFETNVGTIEGTVVFSQEVKLLAEGAEVKCNVEWMTCNDRSCTAPDDVDLSVTIGETVSAAPTVSISDNDSDTNKSKGNLWAMIIEAILWGFAALLTPCVFPMIPMTVSFFIKGSGNKAQGKFRAAMYGLFIVLLYTLPIAVIILLTKFIGGDAVTADIFNWLATHWLPNILFFVIFMAFAASFFGAFEIVMPSKLVNGADQQVDKRSGLGGVFFLALTLVLVSFSCTGPIVGTVLIKSTSGEFWAPIVTMFCFALAFSLPFVAFALFPNVLKKLPKSGGWLNSIKIVLGFIEIALGFKFLSTADQVYHWGILDREVYLAIWIVCFTMLGFYLLGKLRFKNDTPSEYISTIRLALSIVVFTFVVYMIPGMWGAPLRALSGYLPPMETQDFVLGANTGSAATYTPESTDAKYSDFLELPLGLTGYFSLEEAEAAAKREGKPLFIDFTGHGCVNCREMESRVWSDPRVLDLLRNEFIICAMYTDDKLQVPEEDWINTPSGKTLKTLGKINSHIGLERYGVNAQPNYIIQSPDGDIVCPARGYNLDVDAYIAWLKKGLE